MSVTVVDKMPTFRRNLGPVFDDALKEAARDVLIKAKQRAPFDKGRLRSDSHVKQRSQLSWRITFWAEYARFQEFGGDAKRRVRNYTTPGTGKAFLKRSGDEQAKKLARTFKKHAPRVKA
jgi:hypothetical protein